MSAEFINMVSDVQFERFNMHVAELVTKKTPCGIFFGFNFNSQAAVAQIQALANARLNVTCAAVLVDAQADALKSLTSVQVATLEELTRLEVKPRTMFILSGVKDFAFAPYLTDRGFEVLTPADEGSFIFTMKHLPELWSTYEMFGSDESRKVYCAAIKGRVTGKLSDYRFAPEPQYFLSDFLPVAGDVAIDGGAYDGATALDFAKCGAKVYAFEMDAANHKNCAARIDRMGGGDITLENLGLSDRVSESAYSASGAGSRRIPNGALRAQFTDLDTYVTRKNLPHVDYIKLDIEGAELDMLHGAAKSITRCKPKMAVSAYHKWEDLWTLAAYIKSIRADYEFEFRHYRIDCTDYILNDDERAALRYFGQTYLVPTNYEMVLYCR